FGLQILVMFGDPTVGREIFFANGLVLLPLFLPLGLEEYLDAGHLAPLYFFILVASTILWVGLVIRTPTCLDRWRAALACGAMFVLGTTPYLYLPLASMTNPPMNWGYPRTVTGFFHVLTRGQYPLIHLADSVASFVKQMHIYGEITVSQF